MVKFQTTARGYMMTAQNAMESIRVVIQIATRNTILVICLFATFLKI